MTGKELKKYRRKCGLTQKEASQGLAVSQTYLSLLESDERPLTEELKRKVVRVFDLRLTELPAKMNSYEVKKATDDQLTSDLAALGYPGFSHVKPSQPKNPADVLLSALNSNKRDARLIEALPWLLFTFSDLEWNKTVLTAKVYDLQNRLGFITSVARRMAERHENQKTTRTLQALENKLENSKLEKEETLCKETMTRAERNWLKTQRPKEAEHWNLLTDLSPQHLNQDYYATN